MPRINVETQRNVTNATSRARLCTPRPWMQIAYGLSSASILISTIIVLSTLSDLPPDKTSLKWALGFFLGGLPFDAAAVYKIGPYLKNRYCPFLDSRGHSTLPPVAGAAYTSAPVNDPTPPQVEIPLSAAATTETSLTASESDDSLNFPS